MGSYFFYTFIHIKIILLFFYKLSKSSPLSLIPFFLCLLASIFYLLDSGFWILDSDSWLLAPVLCPLSSSLYTRCYFIAIIILLQNKKIKRINPILIFILSYFFLNLLFFFT